MKWNKVLEQIQQALAAGKVVSVRYHRKNILNIEYFDRVESVNEYMWHGVPEYAISTYKDQIAEYSHIIDDVLIGERW